MKEKPILFSTPMVRAILAGNKTQTRRIVKDKDLKCLNNIVTIFTSGEWDSRPLPYGGIGDRLWVKEAFNEHELDDYCLYRATDIYPGIKWKPSIFMPRKYSRIALEITHVRVEQVRDISEKEAIAEGIEKIKFSRESDINKYTIAINGISYNAPTAKEVYKMLWEDINGVGYWDKNPYVWVISFKRVENNKNLEATQ